jgi:hypothetical protein
MRIICGLYLRSWHSLARHASPRLALPSVSLPIMEPHMVCLEQGQSGRIAVSPALIMLVPRRP